MNLNYSFLIFVLFFFVSCGNDDQQNGNSGTNSYHVHVAPHGGQLVEIGEHGSGFNLELVLHSDGFLQIYVLDAHAEEFVRITSDSIDFEIPFENNESKSFVCEAISDPTTGETVGNTSLFTSTERVTDYLPFKAIIPKLNIYEFTYENVAFEMVSNAETSN